MALTLDEELHRHGNLERVVVEEARRWGWRARVENVGVDPEAYGRARSVPARGDVVLERDGDVQTFPYELPEDGSDIRATIRRLVRADEIERDRRGDPARWGAPVEVH